MDSSGLNRMNSTSSEAGLTEYRKSSLRMNWSRLRSFEALVVIALFLLNFFVILVLLPLICKIADQQNALDQKIDNINGKYVLVTLDNRLIRLLCLSEFSFWGRKYNISQHMR